MNRVPCINITVHFLILPNDKWNSLEYPERLKCIVLLAPKWLPLVIKVPQKPGRSTQSKHVALIRGPIIANEMLQKTIYLRSTVNITVHVIPAIEWYKFTLPRILSSIPSSYIFADALQIQNRHSYLRYSKHSALLNGYGQDFLWNLAPVTKMRQPVQGDRRRFRKRTEAAP